MENLMGLLRVRIKKGINLAVRDHNTSDPYVVLRLAKQKLKTKVVKNNLNPEWNDDLTLCITDPNQLVRLSVYDKDMLFDDKMGDAEFDIKPFLEAVKMDPKGIPNGTIITRVIPNRENCLAEESNVVWLDGEVVQTMFIRLRNVESGEIELELKWTHVPGTRGL
ncbi:hypothetical protein V2J09_015128 [Rumex salicifolius]